MLLSVFWIFVLLVLCVSVPFFMYMLSTAHIRRAELIEQQQQELAEQQKQKALLQAQREIGLNATNKKVTRV